MTTEDCRTRLERAQERQALSSENLDVIHGDLMEVKKAYFAKFGEITRAREKSPNKPLDEMLVAQATELSGKYLAAARDYWHEYQSEHITRSMVVALQVGEAAGIQIRQSITPSYCIGGGNIEHTCQLFTQQMLATSLQQL